MLTFLCRRSQSYANQSIDFLVSQWAYFYMMETSVMKKLKFNYVRMRLIAKMHSHREDCLNVNHF